MAKNRNHLYNAMPYTKKAFLFFYTKNTPGRTSKGYLLKSYKKAGICNFFN